MQIIQGDCLEVLRGLPDHSVDAIVSDPPAGINFMNMAFDSDRGGRDGWIAWLAGIMGEALRVIKPGGHALIWALPRTSHWTAYALENAGWEIRDSIEHVFGAGFPKSHDISKAIDRMHGAEREVIGPYIRLGDKKPYAVNSASQIEFNNTQTKGDITAPATLEAQRYAGFGTALKPAHETWWLCRSPLTESSIAANVLRYGTGGINVDATRVGNESTLRIAGGQVANRNSYGTFASDNINGINTGSTSGRWPSNFLISHSLFCTEDQCIDDCPVLALDRQSGNSKSVDRPRRNKPHTPNAYGRFNNERVTHGHNDSGGASRYFQTFYYCPKPSRRERNAGCEALPVKAAGIGDTRASGDFTQRLHPERGEDYQPVMHKNNHPTVKSISLMSYLTTMITPPGGTVLDPFMGSGTTGIACIQNGFDFIGIEREAEYIEIARARIAHALAERESA